MKTFKKIATGALIGLVFGIFAAGGFYAASAAGKLIKGKLPEVEVNVEENVITSKVPQIEEAEDRINEIGNKIGKQIEDKIEEKNEDSFGMGHLGDKKSDGAEAIPTAEPSNRDMMTTVIDVSDVVEDTMPSLVSVNNQYTTQFNYFGQTYYQDAEGAGSGIIVGQNDEELLLVTNYHVVKDAKALTVTFVDGSEASAYLKGDDQDKDLAVISVNLSDISADTRSKILVARLGDSDKLEVGDPVIAIGNSLGYGQSVTAGVVSALDRPIAASSYEDQMSDRSVETFIQTDAAINFGNSGGALINMDGEVVGINSNKLGGNAIEGMGYAIPISNARPIIEEMMNRQTRAKASEENKGFLGITGVDVDETYSEIYGIPVGVYISSVSPGTGADNAGLIRGDIIVGINDVDVKCMNELKEELSYYPAGSAVTLKILQGTPSGYTAKNVDVILSAALN